ncbi:MAG: amino acid adenylation domain-containing protein, partial [Candidatus Aminicenantes bacterium]
QAFENQEYQYEDLVEQVVVNRDVSRNPLFDVNFLLQDMEVPGLSLPGLKLTPYDCETVTSKFDLMLVVKEAGESLWFCFEYSRKLFKHETIKRYVDYFKRILSGILENREAKISGLEIISPEEKNRLLLDFNQRRTDYPENKTIQSLFEEQVKKTPQHIAVVGPKGEVFLSYRAFNERTNPLARNLRARGMGANDIVGIIVERSVEMVAGIFGILKAGSAYLPIDPDYPQERIDYMLKDSGAKILLSGGRHPDFPASRLPSFPASLPSSLAYIIYTSGSTGSPRGVMIEHGPVVNVLLALFNLYPFTREDTYLLKTSCTFDVSVSELFGWFLGGGRLAVLEKGGERDPREILAVIERSFISHINFVPPMFGAFLEILHGGNLAQLSSLKYIFLAGEALLSGLVNRFMRLNPGVSLENIYGPTEATIYASYYSLWEEEEYEESVNIPIGKPLPNIGLYILDKYDRFQPTGVPGELCISGAGLARGYLNRPGLTCEKFKIINYKLKIKNGRGALRADLNAFGEKKVPGERIEKISRYHRFYRSYKSYLIYKTGDLARWLWDGNIEFLGRMDYQVKVRGFRIELGEIENRLLRHEGVKEAVVVVKEDKGRDKYLTAYIVPGRDGKALEYELREYLIKFLPDYMVPSYFMQVEKIPLTPSGKIHRAALPDIRISPGERYAPPRDEIEKKLQEIWSDILLHTSQLRSSIGIDDNFFQLGGHSLKATALAAKIHRLFDVRLPLVEIFKRPTIRGLSQYIKIAKGERYTPIALMEKRDYYPLSSAQKRLYVLQQIQTDEVGTVYNMSSAWVLEGVLDKDRLEQTFKKLVHRHESLRTSFETVEEEPVQEIHEEVEFEIKYYSATE